MREACCAYLPFGQVLGIKVRPVVVVVVERTGGTRLEIVSP